MGSVGPPADMNPMLDEVVPKSIRGIVDALKLCDPLRQNFEVHPPLLKYIRHIRSTSSTFEVKPWMGEDGISSKPVVYSRRMCATDTYGKETKIPFDLIDGSSPLLLGLDVMQHAVSKNNIGRVTFQRPQNFGQKTFRTCIAHGEDRNKRIKLDFIPHVRSTVSSILGDRSKKNESTMARTLHRVTHVPKKEMETILKVVAIEN